jgi:N-acetylglucosamine-6-sulfatase
MKRIFFLAGWVTALLIWPGVGQSQTARPDIVLIVTDDQAAHTMQYMPFTQALIGSRGVRFGQAFATTPTCSPSRSSIFTGKYSHNHGVIGNSAPTGGVTVFNDTSTLATWLQASGYRTGLFGKYLNEYGLITPAYVPPGWSDWHATIVPLGGEAFVNYYLAENGSKVFYGTGDANYVTNVLMNKAAHYIESTPVGQPLFVYIAPPSPHKPSTPARTDRGKFADLPAPRPPSHNEADVSDKPLWVRQLPLMSSTQIATIDKVFRKHIECLQSIDRGVQSIVDALERTGRLENAVIIYTSDHGYMFGEHRYTKKHAVYEEAARVPLWVRAPGVTPRDDNSLVANIDLAPTIMDLAGQSIPSTVDGKSLVPLLKNTLTSWRNELLLEFVSTDYGAKRLFHAARTTRYVYAEYLNGDRELYDLLLDPYQLTNVAYDQRYEAVTADMRVKLTRLKAE